MSGVNGMATWKIVLILYAAVAVVVGAAVFMRRSRDLQREVKPFRLVSGSILSGLAWGVSLPVMFVTAIVSGHKARG